MSHTTPFAEGHVVHLLQHWGDGGPPAELRVKPPLGSSARVALTVLLSAVTAFGLFLLVILWTHPTPGWWFTVLFTVMIGGLLLALWASYRVALRSGADRQRAAVRWIEIRDAARSSPGVIVNRTVNTSDDGSVSSFELVVRTDPGLTVAGVWRPRSVLQSGSVRSLLQPQVPGVGAVARVWRVAEAEPLVIEVLDPTVAADAGASGVDKYVD